MIAFGILCMKLRTSIVESFMAKAIFNWSGGKDSALALYKIQIEKKIEVSSLLTTLNKKNIM